MSYVTYVVAVVWEPCSGTSCFCQQLQPCLSFAGGVNLDDDDDADRDPEMTSQPMTSEDSMLEDDDMPSGLLGSWLLIT